jgi:Protein of unknown function (DUF1344)
MKKLIPTLAGLALISFLGVAHADEAAGKIKQIGEDQSWFTLESGVKFSLAEGVSLEELKAGDEVTVSYSAEEGKNMATGIAKKAAE